MVVSGGQEWDSSANTMRNVPQRVFDARSRQYVDQGQGGAAPAPVPPKDQLKAGVLYQTPRGPARWDGKQFAPA